MMGTRFGSPPGPGSDSWETPNPVPSKMIGRAVFASSAGGRLPFDSVSLSKASPFLDLRRLRTMPQTSRQQA